MLDFLCKMGVSGLLVVCCGRICDFGGDFEAGFASGFIQEQRRLDFMCLVGCGVLAWLRLLSCW